MYRELEDIWNYRAQLSFEVKSRIAPPNGALFIYPINYIHNITSKNELLSIILNEIKKLIMLLIIMINNWDMYFVIGLGGVSKECFESNPWLHGMYNT